MVKKKSQNDQKPLFPPPKEIENICRVLESTDLGFADCVLKAPGKNEYCATGVLGKNANIDDFEMEDESYFGEIYYSVRNLKEILQTLKKFYGFDISQLYKDKINCPIEGCDSDNYDPLTSPEHVFAHLNDDHNNKKTHKENARLIRIFSQYYNIVTGEKIT